MMLRLVLAAFTLAAWLALAIATLCDRYKESRLEDLAPPRPDDPPLPASPSSSPLTTRSTSWSRPFGHSSA